MPILASGILPIAYIVQGNSNYKMLLGAYLSNESTFIPTNSQYLYIGGMPLAVAQHAASGLCAPHVIVETGAVPSTAVVFFNGVCLVTASYDVYSVFAVKNFNGPGPDYVNQFMLMGTPMALGTDYSWIIVPASVSGTPDEVGSVFIGGLNFLVRRYGGKWYLVMSIQ